MRPRTSEEQQRTITAARDAARRAAFTLARDTGAQVITRPAYPHAITTIRDVEPLDGMNAARELELAARHTTRNYIRAAREAGHTWHDIGTALNLTPGADAGQAGESTAEAAYTYAAGHPAAETARRYGRSFTWTCRTCDHAISDRGLTSGPADDEHGHAEHCPRLAATIAARDAGREAGQ